MTGPANAPLKFKRMELDVLLKIGEEEQWHHLVILNPDRLRGEQAGAQLKVGAMADVPMTYTTLWAWAACRRLGIVDKDVNGGKFLNEVCLEMEGADEEGADVDPTQSDPPTDSA